MSIEARISISATFPDDDSAKDATSKLKKSLKISQHELASALNALNPIENQSDYVDDTINVEDISRKKNILSIYAYTYTSEEPIWFAKSIYELGANKVFIRGQWDGHGRNYYFLNGEKVSKKIYDGDKPKKPLSAKDIEINRNLFLPEGRVTVRARLLSTWSVGDIYESTGIEFEALDGTKFYHQGKGQLVDALYNFDKGEFDTMIEVEFSASFERGKLEDKYVSFAKRPTKIVAHRN